jgi:methylmalonyl-CoA epimerase
MDTHPSLAYPIDHVGVAVTDLESAIQWYTGFMHGRVALREELPSQGVKLAFIDSPTATIELLQPLTPDSPLGRFLTKRGPGLHHVCYRVPDIEKELLRLTSLGMRLIDQKPRPGARGSQIAFIHPESTMGVLTEICQPATARQG